MITYYDILNIINHDNLINEAWYINKMNVPNTLGVNPSVLGTWEELGILTLTTKLNKNISTIWLKIGLESTHLIQYLNTHIHVYSWHKGHIHTYTCIPHKHMNALVHAHAHTHAYVQVHGI